MVIYICEEAWGCSVVSETRKGGLKRGVTRHESFDCIQTKFCCRSQLTDQVKITEVPRSGNRIRSATQLRERRDTYIRLEDEDLQQILFLTP